MMKTQHTKQKASATPEKARIVIEYGDKPYVVKQGEREIRRFARCDEAEQFVAHGQNVREYSPLEATRLELERVTAQRDELQRNYALLKADAAKGFQLRIKAELSNAELLAALKQIEDVTIREVSASKAIARVNDLVTTAIANAERGAK